MKHFYMHVSTGERWRRGILWFDSVRRIAGCISFNASREHYTVVNSYTKEGAILNRIQLKVKKRV